MSVSLFVKNKITDLDGYSGLTATSAELNSAVSLKHSQNTDTGSSNDFTLASGKKFSVTNGFDSRKETILNERFLYVSEAEMTTNIWDTVDEGGGSHTVSFGNYGLQFNGTTNNKYTAFLSKVNPIDIDKEPDIYMNFFLASIENLLLYLRLASVSGYTELLIDNPPHSNWQFWDGASIIDTGVGATTGWHTLKFNTLSDRTIKVFLDENLVGTSQIMPSDAYQPVIIVTPDSQPKGVYFNHIICKSLPYARSVA